MECFDGLGATGFNLIAEAFNNAASRGHIDIVRLCHEWGGASDDDRGASDDDWGIVRMNPARGASDDARIMDLAAERANTATVELYNLRIADGAIARAIAKVGLYNLRIADGAAALAA